MGMPCEVNSILKISPEQGYPVPLEGGGIIQKVVKDGYRIYPIGVPIPLVDENWRYTADVVITHLVWEKAQTKIAYEIVRILNNPVYLMKAMLK